MPVWNRLRKELEARDKKAGKPCIDELRKEKYAALANLTGRPLVVYAADCIHNPDKRRMVGPGIQINYNDKDGLFEVIEEIKSDKIDLLLHSSGGNSNAADAMVAMLRDKFTHIRAIIPNMAKSAATMIALSADEILMDVRGELGPIDPQMILTSKEEQKVCPAQAIIDQFERASEEVDADPKKMARWLPMIHMYGPSLIVQAQNAIDLSKTLVEGWLINYMLHDDPNKEEKAKKITEYFGHHNNFLSHGRRVGIRKLQEMGVKVSNMADDQQLHDAVKDVYGMLALTFDLTAAYKLFENSDGAAFIKIIPPQLINQGPQFRPPVRPGIPKKQPPMTRQQRRALERQKKKR